MDTRTRAQISSWMKPWLFRKESLKVLSNLGIWIAKALLMKMLNFFTSKC